jgi:hypothetical protein
VEGFGGLRQCLALLLAAALAGSALVPSWDRLRARAAVEGRLAAVVAEHDQLPLALGGSHGGRVLSSWQSVGGCGAGASAGTVGGVRWIGRQVRGGLVAVETQASYVYTPYGYNLVGSSLLTHELTPVWRLGVGVPYLYKYMRDPFKVGVNLANKGPGDVSLLAARRLGQANSWLVSATVGLPTGTHDTRFRMQALPQDRQLGLGKPTAALLVDHTSDNLWGPVVVGASANWRGGENALHSYRAPTVSAYGYAGYLLGPFVPAAGLSVTGFLGKDRDAGEEMAVPLGTVAGQLSIEWATDWMAMLVGLQLPYDYRVSSSTVRPTSRFGSWIASVGAAFAAF